jgi:YD repeat-containing protein
VRDFGIGMSSSLNFYIVANSAGDFVLYSPDGGEVSYAPTSTTGLYQSVGVSRTYNAAGLPTSMTVPGQTKITYGYDKDEQLTGITQGTTTVSQTWDDLARLSSVTLPDGIKDTNTYDAASELTAQTFTNGSTTVGALDYTYTPDNQISSESGSLASTTLPAAVSSNTYNADNELTDANGAAYTYNADGDLTSTGTSTYTWNDQNQLTGISGATTAALTYNPFGQQATATNGGTTTSYLYEGTAWNSNVLQEQVSGTPTANLLTGATGQIFQFTTPSGTNSSLLTGPRARPARSPPATPTPPAGPSPRVALPRPTPLSSTPRRIPGPAST